MYGEATDDRTFVARPVRQFATSAGRLLLIVRSGAGRSHNKSFTEDMTPATASHSPQSSVVSDRQLCCSASFFIGNKVSLTTRVDTVERDLATATATGAQCVALL